jgi:hypothetical protein
MKNEITIRFTCPNEDCEHVHDVAVAMPCPATGKYGPPERYDEGRDGAIDTQDCQKCGTPFDPERVFEQAGRELSDERNSKGDFRRDEERDNRLAP